MDRLIWDGREMAMDLKKCNKLTTTLKTTLNKLK